MGEPPTNKHSVDRIKSDMNYSCGHCEECIKNGWILNCRWADKYTQANNKSNNHYLILNEQKLTYAQADRKLGYRQGLIGDRVLRGWTVEEALTIPPNVRLRRNLNADRKIYEFITALSACVCRPRPLTALSGAQ